MKGTSHDYRNIRTTSSKAIRLKCLDCCCGQHGEVRECKIYACPIWRYRMGREQQDELYYLAHPTVEIGLLEGSGKEEMALDEEEQI